MAFFQQTSGSIVDGAAVVSTTSATSILPAGAKTIYPASFFNKIGQCLVVHAAGKVSTSGSALNLTLDLRFGSVVIATSGTMVMTTTAAKTNVAWEAEWWLTLRALGGGTAANFMHQGRFTSEVAGATSVVGQAGTILMPQSAPAVGTGFDDTAAAALDMFATWGTSSASNSILCQQFMAFSAPPL
jgi:hypothetical protein